METSVEALPAKKSGSSGVADVVILTKGGEISAQSLSSVELVNVSDLVAWFLKNLILH